MNRGDFLVTSGTAGLASALGVSSGLLAAGVSKRFFEVRGVVLRPDDLTTLDWVSRAKAARLTTIATHDPRRPSVVRAFMESDAGHKFSGACQNAGIQMEHELHAIREFLPREMFAKNPQLFRMDENGDRDAKVYCCVSNRTSIEIISENVVECARVLPSTTGRYFFWIDDNKPMCRCRDCRDFSDSDQAVILENAMLKALRTLHAEATLSHVVYANTLEPPKQVKPESGLFMEFAPISRHYMTKLARRDITGRRGMTHGQILDYLDANLEVFGAESAQVIEYWMNARMFYRQAKEDDFPLFWSQGIFLADLDEYARRGIRRVTCFASGLDGAYVKKFGKPPIAQYGEGLWEYSKFPWPNVNVQAH